MSKAAEKHPRLSHRNECLLGCAAGVLTIAVGPTSLQGS